MLTDQWSYITIKGQNRLDYLLRKETLNEDYKHLQKELDLKIPLGIYNKSDHDDFKTYYDDELKELIYPYVARDLEKFGYPKL